MSRKKALTVEEKRKKMLEIFHESKDVFQIKDIEAIAPKSKGITLQSVKAILQELVDDGLVDSGKIGTGVFYWSFPRKSRKNLKTNVESFEKKNLEASKKIIALEQCIEVEEEKSKDKKQIEEFQRKVKLLEKEKQKLKEKIEKFRENDPEILRKQETEAKIVLEAANRWTDNIFTVKSWCKQKFNIEDKDLDKNFKIPEDLDYLDEN